MKISTVFLLIFVLLVALTVGCEKNNDRNGETAKNHDGKNTVNNVETGAGENSPNGPVGIVNTEVVENGTEADSDDGFDVFSSYYPKELNDLFIISKLRPEIKKTTDYTDQTEFENPQLPGVCLAIREHNISKEEFIRENNFWKKFNAAWDCSVPTYTDSQIEVIFGGTDEKSIKTELKADSAFLYNGKLYNVYEITSADKASLLEMAEKSDLTEYLNKITEIVSESFPSRTDLMVKAETALKTIFDSYMYDLGIVCPDKYHRYYRENMYDLFTLTRIKSINEIVAFASDEYNNLSETEQNRLPLVYRFIKGLSASESDFIRANELFTELNQKTGTTYTVYSNEEIKVLFDDYSSDLTERLAYYLKSDEAISCGSEIYNIFDVTSSDSDTLKELNGKCKLKQYLSFMKAELKNEWGKNELAEKIDLTLNELSRIGNESQINTDFHPEPYELYYPAELNDARIFYEFEDSKAIDKYISETYEKKPPSERKQLPLVYQAVLDLSVSKDDFTAANEKLKSKDLPALTDEQTEILFGRLDAESVKQKLKADSAFYYNGVLFNIRDLETADISTLIQMADNGGLVDFLIIMTERLSEEDRIDALIRFEKILNCLIGEITGQANETDSFSKYYPEELYCVSTLLRIRPWKDIRTFASGDYQKLSEEEKTQLPPLYHFIRGLSVGKEELKKAGEYRKKVSQDRSTDDLPALSDEQLDLLFSGNGKERIMEGLKSETAFYFDGRLWNIYDIASADQTKYEGIKKEAGFAEYYNRMKT